AGALAELAREGADPARATRVRRAHLRYQGTDTALPVPLGTVAEMTAGFERAYRQQFSFLMPGKAILVEAGAGGGAGAAPGGPPALRGPPGPPGPWNPPGQLRGWFPWHAAGR